MRRTNAWVLFSAAILLTACAEPDGAPTETSIAASPAEVAPAPFADPGWTGLTEPEEVIEARRVLMLETERLMKPIDSYIVGEPADPAVLRSNAETLESLLLALPHLFPPTTNQFDPNVRESPTIALPALWQRFPAFLSFAESAERAAASLRDAGDEQALMAASARLRSACDTCHRAFTKPYTPPVVSDEDLEFDFDSVLPPQ